MEGSPKQEEEGCCCGLDEALRSYVVISALRLDYGVLRIDARPSLIDYGL